MGGVMQLSCILAAGVVDEPIHASEFTITSLLKTFPRHLLRQTPNPLSLHSHLAPASFSRLVCSQLHSWPKPEEKRGVSISYAVFCCALAVPSAQNTSLPSCLHRNICNLSYFDFSLKFGIKILAPLVLFSNSSCPCNTNEILSFTMLI